MVNNVLKYRSDNLIILYYCIYSGLSDTMEIVIQSSIGLMKNVRFDP